MDDLDRLVEQTLAQGKALLAANGKRVSHSDVSPRDEALNDRMAKGLNRALDEVDQKWAKSRARIYTFEA